MSSSLAVQTSRELTIDWPRSSIELVRTLKVGRLSKQHSQAASAFARNAPTGLDVQLFVAQDLEVDFFEVASGLCRLLLKKQRPNDALLLMNILSTSLKMLSRRGFNVERILASRKAEREAADARLREERAKAQEKAAQSLVRHLLLIQRTALTHLRLTEP